MSSIPRQSRIRIVKPDTSPVSAPQRTANRKQPGLLTAAIISHLLLVLHPPSFGDGLVHREESR